MNNERKIRKACIKANKGIVELKFGCEVRDKFTKETGVFLCRSHSGSFGYGRGDPKRKEYDIAYNGNYAYDETLINIEYQIRKDFEIIGRSIRLADVLLAIGQKKLVEIILEDGLESTILEYIVFNIWDMTKTLENQSVSTKKFIADLL